MSDNNEKLERLSKMMDEMEKENEEKFFKEGDQQAGQKLADLAGFRKMMETSCKHDWVSDVQAITTAPNVVQMAVVPGIVDLIAKQLD